MVIFGNIYSVLEIYFKKKSAHLISNQRCIFCRNKKRVNRTSTPHGITRSTQLSNEFGDDWEFPGVIPSSHKTIM